MWRTSKRRRMAALIRDIRAMNTERVIIIPSRAEFFRGSFGSLGALRAQLSRRFGGLMIAANRMPSSVTNSGRERVQDQGRQHCSFEIVGERAKKLELYGFFFFGYCCFNCGLQWNNSGRARFKCRRRANAEKDGKLESSSQLNACFTMRSQLFRLK